MIDLIGSFLNPMTNFTRAGLTNLRNRLNYNDNYNFGEESAIKQLWIDLAIEFSVM